MRTVTQLTNNRFLNIKQVVDPENNIGGYQFAERRGVDSIAFVCYDETTNQFLLNKELKPPVNSMIMGAFGGSIDKDKDLVDIVIEEIREEAGFAVGNRDIRYLGKVLVSTQMNQYCHLYLVFVDRNKQLERQPENKIEATAQISWHLFNEISEMEDWKPIVIVQKAIAKKIIVKEGI